MTEEPTYWKHRAQDAELKLVKAHSLIRAVIVVAVVILPMIAFALFMPGNCR